MNLGQGDFLLLGNFSQIGTCGYSIYGSSLSETTGHLNVNGTVERTVSDGNGGYYIAGAFSAVNGVQRAGLARVKADGTLDENFKPFGNLSGDFDLAGAALALGQDKLYVGGNFSSVSNPFGTVVDATTGLSKWPSGVRFYNEILAATADGSGGLYIAVKGSSYQGEYSGAVIHLLANGERDLGFFTSIFGNITVLTYDQATNVLYVGGSSLSDSSLSMSSVLSVHGTSGATLTVWNPVLAQAYTEVTAIAVSPTQVYVSRVNSYNSTNTGLYAINKTNGSILWEKKTTLRSGFSSLAYDSGKIYAAGGFTKVNGVDRNYLAVFDESGTLLASPVSMPDNEVVSLHYADGFLYIGGRFKNVGATAAHGLARYRTSDLTLDAWNPNPTYLSTLGSIDGIVSDGAGTLYVRGDFTVIGGKSLQGIAAITTTGAGTVKDWDVMPSGGNSAPAETIAVGSGGVFVGGTFQSLGAPVIRGLAVLNSATGDAAPFDSKVAGGAVRAITVSQDKQTLYLAGDFSSVRGEVRYGLAALNTADNSLKSWAPVTDRGTFDEVWFVQEYGGIVYVNGYFTKPLGLNLQTRDDFAAIDQSGNVIGWTPATTDPYDVLDFVIHDGVLYISGRLRGAQNKSVAAYDLKNSGAPLALGQSFEGSRPHSLVVHNSGVYVADGSDLFRLEADGSGVKVHSYSSLIGALGVSSGGLFVASNDLGGPQRNGMAIVNFDKSQASDWVASIPMGYEFFDVYTAKRAGDYLYVSGRGENALGNMVGKLFVANIKTGTHQMLEVDGKIEILEALNETVYAGGDFVSVDGNARSGLAAFTSGQLTNWQPVVDGEVSFISHHQGVLYVGGDFATVDGSPRQGLAGFTALTGALLAWSPFAAYDYGYFGRTMVAGDKIYIMYEAEKDGNYEEGLLTVQTGSMQVGTWTPPENFDSYEWFARDGRIYFWDADTGMAVGADIQTGQPISISWELPEDGLVMKADGVFWKQDSDLVLMDEVTGKARVVFREVASPTPLE